MTANRGISQPSVNTVVPVKTPTVQLDPTNDQFANTLQKFQDNVTNTVDSVLEWINNHFSPAAPNVSADGRTRTPNTKKLLDASSVPLNGGVLMYFNYPLSTIPAKAQNMTLIKIPLIGGGNTLTSFTLYADPVNAGSGNLYVATSPGLSIAGQQQSLVNCNVPMGSSPVVVQCNTSSDWAPAAGSMLYVSLYIYGGQVLA